MSDLADQIRDAGRDPSTVGVVLELNADGTVTADVRGAPTVLFAAPSYTDRAKGDRVEVVFRRGLAFATGKMAGPPAAAAAGGAQVRVQDGAATDPGAEALSAFWWVPSTGELVAQRSTPAPPPVGGTLTVTATGSNLGTYDARYGSGLKRTGAAEQGTWTGTGPNTGLAVFGPAAFAALAGKTITAVRVTLHRANAGGIAGQVPIYLGLHAHAYLPDTAGGPTVADPFPVASLRRNATAENVPVPTAWGVALRDGTAAGVGVHAADGANAELDLIQLAIDYA